MKNQFKVAYVLDITGCEDQEGIENVAIEGVLYYDLDAMNVADVYEDEDMVEEIYDIIAQETNFLTESFELTLVK